MSKVLWTFIGNYASGPRTLAPRYEGEQDAMAIIEAIRKEFDHFRDTFKIKATFHVFSVSFLMPTYVRIQASSVWPELVDPELVIPIGEVDAN